MITPEPYHSTVKPVLRNQLERQLVLRGWPDLYSWRNDLNFTTLYRYIMCSWTSPQQPPVLTDHIFLTEGFNVGFHCVMDQRNAMVTAAAPAATNAPPGRKPQCCTLSVLPCENKTQKKPGNHNLTSLKIILQPTGAITEWQTYHGGVGIKRNT